MAHSLLKSRTPAGKPAAYFRDVVLPCTSTDCLIWPFARSGSGYGGLTVDRKLRLVHRLACEARHGPAPSPLHEAAHSCGNGKGGCCNPQHLQWKTKKQNQADRVVHGTHSRGERCKTAKLTEADVREIFRLRRKMPMHEIAKRFGVSATTVNHIYHRRVWVSVSI